MLVALVAIVGTMSIASEAHAAELPLTVQADKSVYGHDEYYYSYRTGSKRNSRKCTKSHLL